MSTTSTMATSSFNNNMSSLNESFKFSLDKMIDQTLLKIEVLTMALMFVMAFVGNSIVILTLLVKEYLKKRAIRANKKRRKTMTGQTITSRPQPVMQKGNKFKRVQFFILHLCLADIYVSLGNILTMLLWRMNNNMFYGNDLACRLVVYFQVVSVYYSTYVLITMTVDRYEAVCKPMVGLSWSPARGSLYIAIAFVLSHLQGVPQIVFFALREIPNSEPPLKTCYAIFNPLWLQDAYILYTWFMQFLIPLVIIIVCYTSISIQVLRSLKGKNTSEKASKTASKKENSDSRERESALLLKPSNINQLSGSNQSIVMKKAQEMNGGGDSFEMRQHCAKNFSKSKIKTIKLTMTVIVLYIICSTPYFIGMVLMTHLKGDPGKLISELKHKTLKN